jgi:hypothetical protein
MNWEATCGYGRVCDWRAISVPYKVFVGDHTEHKPAPDGAPVYRAERCYTCNQERIVQLGGDST